MCFQWDGLEQEAGSGSGQQTDLEQRSESTTKDYETWANYCICVTKPRNPQSLVIG